MFASGGSRGAPPPVVPCRQGGPGRPVGSAVGGTTAGPLRVAPDSGRRHTEGIGVPRRTGTPAATRCRAGGRTTSTRAWAPAHRSRGVGWRRRASGDASRRALDRPLERSCVSRDAGEGGEHGGGGCATGGDASRRATRHRGRTARGRSRGRHRRPDRCCRGRRCTAGRSARPSCCALAGRKRHRDRAARPSAHPGRSSAAGSAVALAAALAAALAEESAWAWDSASPWDPGFASHSGSRWDASCWSVPVWPLPVPLSAWASDRPRRPRGSTMDWRSAGPSRMRTVAGRPEGTSLAERSPSCRRSESRTPAGPQKPTDRARRAKSWPPRSRSDRGSERPRRRSARRSQG